VAAEDFLQDVQVRQSPGDPWLAPLRRVRGKVEFDGWSGSATKACWTCLRCPRARPDAWRLQGASSRVRPGWSLRLSVIRSFRSARKRTRSLHTACSQARVQGATVRCAQPWYTVCARFSEMAPCHLSSGRCEDFTSSASYPQRPIAEPPSSEYISASRHSGHGRACCSPDPV